jgi:hypothetical protein
MPRFKYCRDQVVLKHVAALTIVPENSWSPSATLRVATSATRTADQPFVEARLHIVQIFTGVPPQVWLRCAGSKSPSASGLLSAARASEVPASVHWIVVVKTLDTKAVQRQKAWVTPSYFLRGQAFEHSSDSNLPRTQHHPCCTLAADLRLRASSPLTSEAPGSSASAGSCPLRRTRGASAPSAASASRAGCPRRL